jgi:DNA-binding MarR family transcriptional regulator
MLNMNGLDEMVGFRLKRAQLNVFEDFYDCVADTGLRAAQFSTLLLIEGNEGAKQTDLALALNIQRTNFVKLLDELEARGFAKRKIAEGDKRSHGVFLTKAGKVRLNEAKEAVAHHEGHIADKLGEEGRKTLLSLLSKL